jgi:hypothetical protein
VDAASNTGWLRMWPLRKTLPGFDKTPRAPGQIIRSQAEQILDAIDVIARRVRKLGAVTLRSVGHVSRLQRLLDNDADDVTASRHVGRTA